MFVVRTRLDSSPIYGLGTFADEFIPSGSTIWILHPGFDIEFALQDLDDLPPGRGNDTTVAAQDIQPGKEITCEYCEFDGDAARRLRGTSATQRG